MKYQFITYRKQPIFLVVKGKKTQSPIAALWEWNGWMFKVIDTSFDINKLQLKYSIPDEDIFNEDTYINSNEFIAKNISSSANEYMYKSYEEEAEANGGYSVTGRSESDFDDE